MFYRILLLSLTCSFIFNTSIQSQSPGDVGGGDLELWLRAGDLTTGAGKTNNWNDAQGGNHAVYRSGNSYEVQNNRINFNRAVMMNDEWFEVPLDLDIDDLNAFVVYKSNATNQPLWGNSSNTTVNQNCNDGYHNYSCGYTQYRGKEVFAHRLKTGNSVNTSSNTVTHSHQVGVDTAGNPIFGPVNHTRTVRTGTSSFATYNGGNTVGLATLNNIEMNQFTFGSDYVNVFINGTQEPTLANNITNSGLNDFFIGRSGDNNTSVFNGEIAEVIFYDDDITTNQRRRIASYLAIKYGIHLSHDYVIDGGARTTWSRGTNTGYNNDITGIARDDGSALYQAKSRTENTVNPIVTIEASSAIDNNRYFMWGHNNAIYDNFSLTNTSPKYNASQRVWKVQKDRINNVDISMELPSSIPSSSFPPTLLVAANANFTNTLTTHTGVISGSSAQFTNVSIPNGYYFTLSVEDEKVVFVNNDANAPTAFEACVGSNVSFLYSDLTGHPNFIQMRDTIGNLFTIPVVATGTSVSAGSHEGVVTFVIPGNAGSGAISLLDGTTGLFTKSNFIVHNVFIDFFPSTNPVCATDTISLIGVPSGGSFSEVNPGSSPDYIQNNQIIAPEANWGLVNQAVQTIDVTYTYTPTYIDGTPCAASISKNKSFDIRDNRLESVTFNYILTKTNPPTINDRKVLDTTVGPNINTFLSITPDLNFGSNSAFSYSFSGTYVQDSLGIYTFLTEQSGLGVFPLTFNYNNGGCVGSITEDLGVYPPLRFIGLADTLCREALPSQFTRDTLPEYLHYRDTVQTTYSSYVTTISGPTLVTTTSTQDREYNKITKVIVSPNHPIAFQNAIDSLNTANNNELYDFDPTVIPNNVPWVALEMYYTTIITTTVTNTQGVNISNSNSYDIIAFDTVYLEDRPTPQILNLDNYYCENANSDTLRPIPGFDNPTYTYFKLKADDGFGYNIVDTLVNDTLFDFSYHYNKQVPNKSRHLGIELVYVVDRFGCFDTDTAYTQIIAPVVADILSNSPYCNSDNPSTINIGYSGLPPTGGSGVFYNSPGLDTTNIGYGIFAPAQLPSGEYPIDFEYIDFYGCVSYSSDTLVVRVPPTTELRINNSIDNSFCANDSSIILQTFLLPSNTLATSPVYTGPSISGNIFNPATVFGAGGGFTAIYSAYTDTFGCIGYDTMAIQINPIPTIAIDSFNDKDNISLGRPLVFDHKYCYNDSIFQIGGTPSHLSGRGGVLSGGGIVQQDSSYFFAPNYSGLNSTHISQITYSYTDTNGCTNSIKTSVIIDSIPNTSITGLDLTYCINNPVDTAVGFPDFTTYAGTFYYTGPGINPSTGAFTPLLAGTGEKILSYTYQDSRGCNNTTFDTIIVYTLPTPIFGGYENQYCTAAVMDTLNSLNIQTTGTSFNFWGNVITDPIGILTPSNDTAGPQTIYYQYTDSLGCSDVDSVNIFIHPTPNIVLSGFDSAYCFNEPIDNISIFPTPGFLYDNAGGFNYSGNTISFQPDYDTAGFKQFTYAYVDLATGCSDTLITRTFVYSPPTPEYTGLDLFYCETQDTFPLTGLTPGGEFQGPGIIQTGTNYSFSPAKSGPGFHDIEYIATDTFIYTNTILVNDTLLCNVDTIGLVEVRSLPVPVIVSPSNNNRFCSNDTAVQILPNTINSVLDTFFSLEGGVEMQIDTLLDTITLAGTVYYVFIFDTTYFFNPSLATTGTNIISYIAKNGFGCRDSINYTYLVDGYSDPQFILDPVYCESDNPQALFGIPTGGIFLRNNDTLTQPFAFDPNPIYQQGAPNTSIGNTITDTMIYVVQDGACYGSDTQYIQVNPVPQVTLNGPSPLNVYCLSSDTVQLTISPLGGQLIGPGVLFGRDDVILNIAGAGIHAVYYTYTDAATSCSNTAIDTFKIWGQPTLDFEAIGGCQADSIFFLPDNQNLNLGNTFSNGTPIDSISNITWHFNATDSIVQTGSLEQVDSVHHIYSSPGIYYPTLIVTNRNACADTGKIRLVISPIVTNYPYAEDFETSDGNWYAESRNASTSLLWQWGTDNNSNGIGSSNNQFWETNLNNAYSINEDDWVYSPCFDLDTLDRPMIKFDYWSDARQGIDGTVLEFQAKDGSWQPLGKVGRGINWYNTNIISGQPGDQTIAPIGWSGKSHGWKDARYKLDEFLGQNRALRMRMAFGSSNVNSSGYYDGFAFDDIWIGNRERKVLLETFSNIEEPTMMQINNYVYNLAFHTPTAKDVVLTQYNCCVNDEFYLENQVISNNRAFFYGNSSPGIAYIDGVSPTVPYSIALTEEKFETSMLEFPKFTIDIDTFYFDAQHMTVRATVTAQETLPIDNYTIYTVITEDSLLYSNNVNMVQAIARENQVMTLTNHDWIPGQTEPVYFQWNHGAGVPTYNPDNFQVVVFIQNNSSREVYQVNSSRDVSGYWVGTKKVEASHQLEEIRSFKVYPNPANDYFQVEFEENLEEEYIWKIVDMRGIELKSGTIDLGTKNLQINSEELPSGIYIFTVQNNNVFSQRKIIINNN